MKNPTEQQTTPDAARLFRIVSTATLRFEEEGRTRVYEGVPMHWEVVRDAPPVVYSKAIDYEELGDTPGDERRTEDYINSLFSQEEAFRVLEAIEKERPEDEHRLVSIPLPVSHKAAPSEPGVFEMRNCIELTVNEVDVRGWYNLHKADREGWEDGDTLLVETTLELPVELADRLNEKHDAAEYLQALEETAETISEIPNPNAVGEDSLPF